MSVGGALPRLALLKPLSISSACGSFLAARRYHATTLRLHSLLTSQQPSILVPSIKLSNKLAPRSIAFKSTSSSSPIDMEVTKDNFAETLPLVKEALAQCHFFAIDCEMTGLFVEDGRPNGAAYLADMDDRYQEILASSSNFVINQFGLSAFIWENGAYKAKTFNFYVFPRPFEGWDQRFLSQAGSLNFLASCHFDFNKWIHQGIGYLPIGLRDSKLAAVDKSKDRQDILITKDEDVAFVEETLKKVVDWMESELPCLELDPCNSYQRAMQYQTLRNNADKWAASDPPGFYIERIETEEGKPALKLQRATAEQVAAWEAQQRQNRLDAIHDAAGFSAVMEVIRDSNKPMIGHNLSFDLSYSLNSFVKALPPTWEEYKALVAQWFPAGIYDTKYLARRFSDLLPDTSLGFLHAHLDDHISPTRDTLSAGHARGFERYLGVSDVSQFAHEAGYDAFMTGAVFARLLAPVSERFESAAAAAAGGGVEELEFVEFTPIIPKEEEIEEAKEFNPAVPIMEELTDYRPLSEIVGGPAFVSDVEMADAIQEESLELRNFPPTVVGGAVPSLKDVEQFKWRLNLSRSDMEYAALQGDDYVPDRSHVVYVSSIKPGTFRHGGELIRLLVDPELGQLRCTMVESGTAAIVECAEKETAPTVAKLLEERIEGCTVGPYEQYSALKKARRDAALQEAADAKAARRVGNNNKRPRIEAPNTPVPEAGEEGAAASKYNCSIM